MMAPGSGNGISSKTEQGIQLVVSEGVDGSSSYGPATVPGTRVERIPRDTQTGGTLAEQVGGGIGCPTE